MEREEREEKEHVEKHPSGVSMCKACGGEVGPDGYSAGGIIGEDEPQEVSAMRAGVTDEPVEQGVAGDRLSDEAFMDSIKRRKGGGR